MLKDYIKDLIKVDISGNHLLSIRELNTSYFGNLIYLKARFNMIKHANLDQLKGLVHLDLSHNKLVEIPKLHAECGTMDNIELH